MSQLLEVTDVDGVTFVNFEIDKIYEPQVEDINNTFKSLIESGRRKIVIDFSGVTYCHRSFLDKLVIFHKSLDCVGGMVVLCCIYSDQINRKLRETQLDKFFTIDGTRDEASALFQK